MMPTHQTQTASPQTHHRPRQHRRRRRLLDAVVDLAPMVDVVFLLLLFFMFTATYETQKTLDTPPVPDPAATLRPTRAELRDQFLFVEIRADNTLRIDDQPVTWDALTNQLRRRAQQRQTESLIIVAHDAANWENVVRIQDEAALAGIRSIRFGKPVKPTPIPNTP